MPRCNKALNIKHESIQGNIKDSPWKSEVYFNISKINMTNENCILGPIIPVKHLKYNISDNHAILHH